MVPRPGGLKRLFCMQGCLEDVHLVGILNNGGVGGDDDEEDDDGVDG